MVAAILFLLLIICAESLSLTLHNIDVPAHRLYGDSANLLCNFDMEGDVLYSVKWYKDEMEFYRYVPNDHPKLQVFHQQGIHVDKTRSSKRQVVLTNLTLESAGAYKCEVSAEAPEFKTKSAVQDMVVVVSPKKADIRGAQPKYQVGDTVNVTCISYRSKPAASLTWRVNDIEVMSRYDANYQDLQERPPYLSPLLNAQIIEYKPQTEDVVDSGLNQHLETSALGLIFRVVSAHVGVGLKLECTASIGSVYWQSFLEKIPVGPKEQQPVTGTWWTSASSSSSLSFNQSTSIIFFYGLVVVFLMACITPAEQVFLYRYKLL